MAIKLDELSCWKLLKRGENLLLPCDHDEPRRVRIDLNVEERTWIYVASEHIKAVDAQFVAAVGPGCETLEFWGQGDLAITFAPDAPEDHPAQVWLYTAEIEPNVSASDDAVSFTEIHQRRARNPELEMMQLIARQNERRLDEKMAHLEALISEKEKQYVDTGEAPEPAGQSGEQPVREVEPAPNAKPGGGVEQSGGEGNELPAG